MSARKVGRVLSRGMRGRAGTHAALLNPWAPIQAAAHVRQQLLRMSGEVEAAEAYLSRLAAWGAAHTVMLKRDTRKVGSRMLAYQSIRCLSMLVGSCSGEEYADSTGLSKGPASGSLVRLMTPRHSLIQPWAGAAARGLYWALVWEPAGACC